MHLKALLAALTLCSIALAGCSDGGSGDGEGTTTSSSSSSTSRSNSTTGTSSATSTTTSSQTTTTGSGNGTGNGTVNRAPTGTLSATPTNGSAPLNVTFNVTASDLDNQTVNWTLSFGDGTQRTGTNASASVSHNYTTAGLYTARYNLTDGNLTASYNVTINATVGGPTGGTTLTGDVSVACDIACGDSELGAAGCTGFKAQTSGLDCIYRTLPAGSAGRPFTIVSTSGDPDAEFLSTCSLAAWPGTIVATGEGEEGTVPAGAGCVVIWEYTLIFPGDTSTITMVVS